MRLKQGSIFLLVLFVWLSLQVNANVKKQAYRAQATYELHKWEVLDIVFKSKFKGKKPFATQFDAQFTGLNGEKQQVPGFFNGDDEWVIRFSASAHGQWSFVTSSEGLDFIDILQKIVL